MLLTTYSESTLNRNAMPTLVPARPSWPESRLRGHRADRRVERQRRADEDLRAGEPPRRAHELARDDQIDGRRAHRVSMSHGIG